MSDLKQLEQRIQEKVAAAKARKQDHQSKLRREMADREQLAARFNRVADRLVEAVIRPRVEKLGSQFDNAEILPLEKGLPHHCVCRFDRTELFPATTKLDLALCPDDRLENVLALYTVEILPVLCQFQGRDQKVFPVDNVDEEQLAAWVDDKILGFLETYLRLGDVDQYQKQNLVTDPVCGMEINKTVAAARMDFEGHTYYFCVEECRRKFAEDPGQYVIQQWAKKHAAM